MLNQAHIVLHDGSVFYAQWIISRNYAPAKVVQNEAARKHMTGNVL